MTFYRLTAIGLLAVLSGCGGDDGSSSEADEDPIAQIGRFLDSPVINIGYRTETLAGTTNASGEYEYLPGESVTFFIGDLEFPAVTAKGIVTPLDLSGTSVTTDAKVVNMIRLLQTLDQDGNPDNGITITDTAKAAATQVDFNLSESDFADSPAVSTLIMNGGQDTATTGLVDAQDAIAHFETQLAENAIALGRLPGVWKVEDEVALFAFLPDGEYFALQWEEENDFAGFERGAYIHSNGELLISTIQNHDGEALFCNAPRNETDCKNDVFGLTKAGNGFTLEVPDEGAFSFIRQEMPGSGIVGTWQISRDSEPGPTLFIFLENNEYYGIEWGNPSGSSSNGYEQGTYSYSGTDLLITTIDNNDGDALLCNLPESATCTNEPYPVTIDGDKMVIDFQDEAPVQFFRHF